MNTRPAAAAAAAGRASGADGDAAPSALIVRGLAKRYGEQLVVDDFSLDVADGEFVTLLGASGSGKTTTLMMVAGFVQPSAGTVEIAGRDMTVVAPERRNIGMMFQSYALFPHMTVADNVAFPLKRRRMPRARAAELVADSLRRVHLTGFEDRYPAQLSGGQQQRVALARATVYSPPLLLMDEPLSALDHNLRRRLQDELKRFHRDDGTSILYVTHDQEEALALSDRIAVMDEGRVVQIGTPQEIYERPASLFVAQFLGESNCLHGRVVAHDRDTTIVETAGGRRVGGMARATLPVGDPAVVVIRPDHLAISPAGDDGDGDRDGALGVVVEEMSYVGGRVRCRGRFASGEACVLVVDSHAGVQALSEGGTGCVRWDPAKAVVVPGEDRAATAPAPG